jgi:hypothetical protein
MQGSGKDGAWDGMAPTYSQRLAAAAGGDDVQHTRGMLAAALCKARQDILLSVFVTRPAVWSPFFNLAQASLSLCQPRHACLPLQASLCQPPLASLSVPAGSAAVARAAAALLPPQQSPPGAPRQQQTCAEPPHRSSAVLLRPAADPCLSAFLACSPFLFYPLLLCFATVLFVFPAVVSRSL